MHTGEPLFSGVDSHDQMYKLVSILGMPPQELIQRAERRRRLLFFGSNGSGQNERYYLKRPQRREKVRFPIFFANR